MTRFLGHRWKARGDVVLNLESKEPICILVGDCTRDKEACGYLVECAPDMYRMLRKISQGHYIPPKEVATLVNYVEGRGR